MLSQFASLIELLDYFKDERSCIQYFINYRWPDAKSCPHCESDCVYEYTEIGRFRCGECSRGFSSRVGTIFEASKISFRKWFVAIFLMLSDKNGVSSYQLARQIKVTQKTAWFMLHRIRWGLGLDNSVIEQVDGIVECDETFVGGKNKNRHKSKKVANSQGRAFKDKTPIFGLIQRGGKVRTVAIPNTRAEVIQPLIRQMVKGNATLITDEWHAYKGLNGEYNHLVVDHGRGQYVNGYAHTNTMEGFWTSIKRSIMGSWHHVSRKHLQMYAHECTFKYNTRRMSDSERMLYALSLMGVRLKYKDLIGKAA